MKNYAFQLLINCIVMLLFVSASLRALSRPQSVWRSVSGDKVFTVTIPPISNALVVTGGGENKFLQ